MRLAAVLGFLFVCASQPASLQAADPEYKPVPASLFHIRDGIGNTLAKLKAGGDVRIAYLGGSITAANGWRLKTRAWFADQFPEATVTEIHAAIGGTGSDLGVFRLEHDVLRHHPDLLFVEFAVNDGGASPEKIWRAMEGIVRQTWQADSKTDICFVYTFRVGYEKDLGRGMCPRAASAMESLAQHYAIPSINVALRIVQMQAAGQLVFKSDHELPNGVMQFSKDGVHPLDGGHGIYRDVIAEAVLAMQKTAKPQDYAAKLAVPFVSHHWTAAKMIPLDKSMLTGSWKPLAGTDALVKRFGQRMGVLWETETPGSAIQFRFRGSQAKLYDLLGPDGGQVVVTVDGKTRPKPIPRFDSYCTYHRIATLPIANDLDPDRIHTVRVELHPEQPDRSAVAFRLKDPKTELKSPKFQGTRLRVSHLMLLGELVPANE